jgi:hypothetical protein
MKVPRGGDAAAAAARPPVLLQPPQLPRPWHTGIDAEFIGHAQNKGWKLDDPKEAFVAATKQARELEKHFGVPPDRLVKLPAPDAKPEDIRAYYERIGAPKEAKDYDLSAIKDQAIADTLRATLHNSGVPKDAAAAVAKSSRPRSNPRPAADHRGHRQARRKQKAKLQGKLGPELRIQQAEGDGRRAPARHDPRDRGRAGNLIGYDGMMETLRKIGVGTSEATFIDRGIGTNGQVTTKEGAVARKQELMADKAWADRYLANGVAEKREMTGLNMMIAGTRMSLTGLTVKDCPKACNADGCVISGKPYCAHPRKGGLHGRTMGDRRSDRAAATRRRRNSPPPTPTTAFPDKKLVR